MKWGSVSRGVFIGREMAILYEMFCIKNKNILLRTSHVSSFLNQTEFVQSCMGSLFMAEFI